MKSSVFIRMCFLKYNPYLEITPQLIYNVAGMNDRLI